MTAPRVWLAAALLATPTLARAQDVPSGPPQGERVPALPVYDVTGEHGGTKVDYAADRKGAGPRSTSSSAPTSSTGP
jgi:hypothetical protein